MNIKCNICGNSEDNRTIIAPEMMRGTRDNFEYLECSSCGSLQLIDVPKDMSQYYDNSTYGSFVSYDRGYFKNLMRIVRNKYAILQKGGVIGLFLNWYRPLTYDFTAISYYSNTNSKILEIGCGIGIYIKDLGDIGFTNVCGIDPFIDKDIIYPNGVKVKKLYIEQVNELYDVIISHHSLEHVPDPLETLISIKKQLNQGGVCILTVPVAEDLYRQYRQNCYLIQAPQHFYLLSIKGLLHLAFAAGLRIEAIQRISFDTADWYKYSELWERNVAINEIANDKNRYFTGEELRNYKKLENELSNQKKGDNVTFILRNDSYRSI